jgi:hypothetical protein
MKAAPQIAIGNQPTKTSRESTRTRESILVSDSFIRGIRSCFFFDQRSSAEICG